VRSRVPAAVPLACFLRVTAGVGEWKHCDELPVSSKLPLTKSPVRKGSGGPEGWKRSSKSPPAPQVRLYANFWSRLTSAPARGGLFFVDGCVEGWVR